MPTDEEIASRRAHRRVRLALEVSYRSTGSFLVSYSVDLSSGGLFLETEQPRQIGTELELWLSIPGATEEVRLKGDVVWVRQESRPGQPAGMGIQFQDVEGGCGQLIDSLVKQFSGLRVLVYSASTRVRNQLNRLLRTSLAATVDEFDLDKLPFEAPTVPYDLMAIDLGNGDEKALQLLKDVVGGGYRAAVIALSAHPRFRQEALDLGADEAIVSPPILSELKAVAIRALARPLALPSEDTPEPGEIPRDMET